jgi:hypothetical protein
MSEEAEDPDRSQGSGPHLPASGRRYRLENPRFVRLLICAGIAVLVGLVVIDLLVDHKGHFTYDQITIDAWPEFFPIYGFASSLAFVLIAKALGLLLKRKGDYYHDADVPMHREEP